MNWKILMATLTMSVGLCSTGFGQDWGWGGYGHGYGSYAPAAYGYGAAWNGGVYGYGPQAWGSGYRPRWALGMPQAAYAPMGWHHVNHGYYGYGYEGCCDTPCDCGGYDHGVPVIEENSTYYAPSPGGTVETSESDTNNSALQLTPSIIKK